MLMVALMAAGFLWLNERKAPFDNAKVRLAFAHAVNRAAVVHEAYGDLAEPTDQMLPPGLPGYRPLLGGVEYNPRIARQLLAEAGFPHGRGLPPITYAVDQGAENLTLASAVVAQWRQTLGVRVHLVQYGHSDYLTLLDKLNYQVAAVDWTADYPDPENFLTQQLQTGTPNNNGRWSNLTFDRLVRQAAAMPTESPARLARYYRAQEIAMGQAATIPLANPSAGILLRQTVHGLTIQGGQLLARDWTKVSISRGSGL